MTRTEIVMQAMTPDELDALIRDAEAERERRKVKPCVRRMEDNAITGLTIDGTEVCAVWRPQCEQLNIDHATAKRQIALAFCWADWGTRANLLCFSNIKLGTKIHDEFCWLVGGVRGLDNTSTQEHAARAAGWIE
jgi:hypothetical protein